MHFLIIFKGLLYCLDLSNSEFTLLWNDSSQSNIELSLSTSSLFYQKEKIKKGFFFSFQFFLHSLMSITWKKKKKHMTERLLLFKKKKKKVNYFPDIAHLHSEHSFQLTIISIETFPKCFWNLETLIIKQLASQARRSVWEPQRLAHTHLRFSYL